MEEIKKYDQEILAAFAERTIKRLWILIILLVLLLFGTNAAWIYYESQFIDETVTQEVWQEAENGENSFVGGDYYGTAKSENYANDKNS